MNNYNRDSLLWLAIKHNDIEDDNNISDDGVVDAGEHVKELDDYLTEPLENILRKENDVNLFLTIFGIIWVPIHTSRGYKCINYGWNIVARIVLVLCPILITVKIILTNVYNNKEAYLVVWGLDLLFIIQSLALSWSLVSIKQRLMSISTQLEVSYFSKTLKYAVLYFALNLFPTLLYPIVASINAFGDPERYSFLHLVIYMILPVSELVILQLLSVHVLFILVDIQVLFSTFMKIYGIDDSSHDDYSKKKVMLKEIHRRVKKTLYATSPIVVTAIMEVVVLTLVQYLDNYSSSIGAVMILVYLFLKDIILVAIVCFMVTYYVFNIFCKV